MVSWRGRTSAPGSRREAVRSEKGACAKRVLHEKGLVRKGACTKKARTPPLNRSFRIPDGVRPSASLIKRGSIFTARLSANTLFIQILFFLCTAVCLIAMLDYARF